MSYRDIPKITNRRVNTTFNNNAASVAITSSSLTPTEGSRTTRGTFPRKKYVAPLSQAPQVYAVIRSEYAGKEEYGQNPDYKYVDLLPLKLDGTVDVPFNDNGSINYNHPSIVRVRTISIPNDLDAV